MVVVILSKNPIPKKLCSINECSKAVKAKSLCSMHLTRLYRNGNALIVRYLHGTGGTVIDRFWSRVDKNGPTHPTDPTLGRCWEWTGHLSNGYGELQVEKERWRCHQYSWFLTHGHRSNLFIARNANKGRFT